MSTTRNPSQRPNIIYIMADQLRYQSCGYAGDRLAQTPNIDRLSAEGVNFRQCVSSMPVCAAYRASLFTGKYTSSTGMVINEIRINPDHHRCLGHVLTDGGYETAYIGKWHLYAAELGNHTDPRNSFVPRGPHRLGFDGYWAGYNFHHNYYQGYYHEESAEKIFIPEGVYEPDAQTDLAIEQVRRLSTGNKPFAMVLSVGTPHDAWTKENVPPEYYARFRNATFDMSPSDSDELDPYGDDWSNCDKSPDQIGEWMRCYYAMTANLDWNVGRLLDAVEQAGIADSTIVVFTSDHGEMFGAQGRMKKNTFYEEAVRVPFLVRWPTGIPAGTVSDACLGTVDIMPTLLSTAGLPIPDEVEGMDLSHCARCEPGPEPEAAFLMNTGACAVWEDGHEWRALRDRRFTYACYREPRKELLFDSVADPYQMVDLSADPTYASDVDRFRHRLREKMESLNDTFLPSTWYRDNWVKDRIILQTATRPHGTHSAELRTWHATGM